MRGTGQLHYTLLADSKRHNLSLSIHFQHRPTIIPSLPLREAKLLSLTWKETNQTSKLKELA